MNHWPEGYTEKYEYDGSSIVTFNGVTVATRRINVYNGSKECKIIATEPRAVAIIREAIAQHDKNLERFRRDFMDKAKRECEIRQSKSASEANAAILGNFVSENSHHKIEIRNTFANSSALKDFESRLLAAQKKNNENPLL